MKLSGAGLALAVVTLAGCGSDRVVEPRFEGSGFLRIETTPSENPEYVFATVLNLSDRTFYSNVGDAYNSSLDQEDLCACVGSDGAIERQVAPRRWLPVQTTVAIEGTRVIVLRPGHSYRLVSGVDLHSSGWHRVRLEYADQPGMKTGRQTYRDFSNAFLVSPNPARQTREPGLPRP